MVRAMSPGPTVSHAMTVRVLVAEDCPGTQPIAAQTLKADRDRCVAAGCNDHLAKPLDERAFPERMQRHLGGGNDGDDRAGGSVNSPAAAADDAMEDLRKGYVASLREAIASLERAFANGDQKSIRTIAHQTRGVAGMYGYQALAETAGLLEDAIIENEHAEIIQELVDEFAQCARSIDRAATSR